MIFGAVMLAAIVSSMLPDFYVLMVRSDDIIPNKGILGNKYFKYALCGVISATVVISMSLLGLDVLVSKGLTIMGYVAMPLIMIPVCIYWPLHWRKEDRAKKQAEEAA